MRQAAVLGCHPQILALSAERFRSAIGSRYAPEEVLWLFVGRGSHDAAATAEMGRFVTGRLALTPVGHVVVAFLAMAQPRVEAVVPQIAAMDFATVVVQPHLLYPGTLLSRLQRIVDDARSRPAPATMDLGGVFGVRPRDCPGGCGAVSRNHGRVRVAKRLSQDRLAHAGTDSTSPTDGEFH